LRRVLLVAFGLVAILATTVQGEGVARQDASQPEVQMTEGDVVGASIAHPAGWAVERGRYTFDGTYGYTLWRPEQAASGDHGGVPAVRVARDEKLEPSQVGDEIEQTLSYYERQGLDVGRETVDVGEHEGVAFGPIPGSTPATRVYTTVNGRVYRIDVYSEAPGEEGLDADDRRLLRTLRFERPTRSVASLGLPRANAPKALYSDGEEPGTPDFRSDTSSPEATGEAPGSVEFSAAATRERRLTGGCRQADPDFWVQVQHGPHANSNKKDGIPTGWTRIGVPNFWGQYTHGNLGYGRCDKPYYANDEYAVDYPMDRGDPVWSPFDCGRVTFAGRNQTHIDYGILVSIKACNGKYYSLTSHFSALPRGLNKGDRVNKDTVIGYAGHTGGPRIPVGQVHFHQVFYRYPKQNPDGSPYGGQGLQVDRLYYVGTAARKTGLRVRSHVYVYRKVKPDYGANCLEGLACGEGYRISN
jgi:murein DD-endopeptidase MepM/ murein hydrolase activator NlpD